jgi:hypothetical protein
MKTDSYLSLLLEYSGLALAFVVASAPVWFAVYVLCALSASR